MVKHQMQALMDMKNPGPPTIFRIVYSGCSSAEEAIIHKFARALELSNSHLLHHSHSPDLIIGNFASSPSKTFNLNLQLPTNTTRINPTPSHPHHQCQPQPLPRPDLIISFHGGQDCLRSSTTWRDSECLRRAGLPVLDIVDTPHYGAISAAFQNPTGPNVSRSGAGALPAAIVGLAAFLRMTPEAIARRIDQTTAPYTELTLVRECTDEYPHIVYPNPWWDADVAEETTRAPEPIEEKHRISKKPTCGFYDLSRSQTPTLASPPPYVDDFDAADLEKGLVLSDMYYTTPTPLLDHGHGLKPTAYAPQAPERYTGRPHGVCVGGYVGLWLVAIGGLWVLKALVLCAATSTR